MGCGASSNRVAPDVGVETGTPQKPTPPPQPEGTTSKGDGLLLALNASDSSRSVVLKAQPSSASRSLREESKQSVKSLWVRAFLDCDPRRHIVDFFKPGDERGPYGYLRAQGLRPRGAPTAHFAVWRPTSMDAMRMLFDGTATGKGLNVKGKSAKSGVLSGFVPFLQISEEGDKAKVGTSPADARTRVFYRSRDARAAARAALDPTLAEMVSRATQAKQQLTLWKSNELELDDAAREAALSDMQLQCEPPTLEDVDEHNETGAYGLDMPERLLWQTYVLRKDIGHPAGWETGRVSEPAFMDLNMQATRERKVPLAAVWQWDQDDPMNPRGLLIAHEEPIGVRPVASDIDAFLIGSRGMPAGPALPEEQLSLVRWCMTNVERVLNEPKAQGWTKRWLEVLKLEATNGFHPTMPEFGFGDPRSYDIMLKAVERLNISGAVRHGAECFNFYFPQELDEEFLVVWDGFPAYYGGRHAPWKYVGREGLRSFLMARLEEGYAFPLNPKWILCDEGFREIYRAMESLPHAQPCIDTWLPPGSGLREQLKQLLDAHPHGFQPILGAGEDVVMMDNDMAEWELNRHKTLMRAKAKLKAVYKFNKIALDMGRTRAAAQPAAPVAQLPSSDRAAEADATVAAEAPSPEE